MQKNVYVVPLAIIVAGGLIGGGLAFGLFSYKTPDIQDEEFDLGKYLPIAAEKTGLDMAKFTSCVGGDTYSQKIQEDATEAVSAGAKGTPYTILIDSKGNKMSLSGALPYENMKTVIDAVLGKGVPLSQQMGENIVIRPVIPSDHIRGNDGSVITLIEYSDLECPFCASFHPTVSRITGEYPGKIRWAYRHLPLTQIHSHALPAAKASECAAEQGKFWEYINLLFTHGKD